MNIRTISGAISRHDVARMDKHAKQYYEQIRRRKSDVSAIAENTGFSVQDVQAIKNHVFMNYHDLGEIELLRFTPDYDMSVSWQRLIDGHNIQEMDLVMIKHELLEIEIMAQGAGYHEAHKQADSKYSYSRYVKELDAKEDIF